jgi:NAD(P)-dependent dehydrogenase (short-subunit alcohol dehydrogenase family)
MVDATVPGRLEGRRVLLTGASGGMGQSVAERFLAEGAAVVLTDLPGPRIDATLAAVERRGAVSAIRADLRDEASVRALVDGAAESLGGLDVVYNNAGVRFGDRDGGVDTIDLAVWEATFAVNVTGTFLVCKYAIPHLLQQPGPVIINVASMAGIGGDVFAHAYSASKGAMLALTKSMAHRWGPDGLRSVAICPGMIDTEMLAPVKATVPETELAGTTALRRLGRPEEIAGVAAFLASSDASFVTASFVEVHGGLPK